MAYLHPDEEENEAFPLIHDKKLIRVVLHSELFLKRVDCVSEKLLNVLPQHCLVSNYKIYML